MSAALERIDRLLTPLVVALLALLVGLSLFETLAWSILQVSIPQLLEVQALLLVWFTLLSAAWALPRRLHLALDWLPTTTPARWRAGADAVAHAFTALFGLAYAIYGGALTAAVRNTLPATGLPAATHYAAAVVAGGAIALLAGALCVVELHRAWRDGADG